MAYEKLSRRALGCMYTAEIIGDVIFIVLIGIVNIFWLIPKQIEIGRWISAVLLIYAAVSMLVEPYFRYNRYRYSINEECIDIREGYLFVKRNIVPIERLHKLEISKGPIDQIFHVAKVNCYYRRRRCNASLSGGRKGGKNCRKSTETYQ